jgi:signal recognition particle receptor subunit alpha
MPCKRNVPFQQTLFDTTFTVLLNQVQGEEQLSIDESDVLEYNQENGETMQPGTDAAPENLYTVQKHGTKKGKKGKKEGTVWHDSLQKVTKEAMAALDQSKDSNPNLSGIDAVAADDSHALAEARAVYLPRDGEIPLWEERDELEDTTSDDATAQSKSWGMALKGLFDQVSGNKILTAQDLESPLDDMQKLLTSKNVSSEIASVICATVKAQLVGKRMASFSRVKTAVRIALEESIEKILKPAQSRDVNVLRAVVLKREQQRNSFFHTQKQEKAPFVIVMVGINGVGTMKKLYLDFIILMDDT